MSHPTIGIIGLGKVGETFLHLLNNHGYLIGGVYNRTSEKLSHIKQKRDLISGTVAEVVEKSDLLIIAVSDDAIESIAGEIANTVSSMQAVIHTSGAKGLDVLEDVRRKGAMVGSLHPVYPFSDVDSAIEGLAGSTFAIEYSASLLQSWLLDIVETLHGQVIVIPEGKKAQYHAALAIASNYMVSLYAIAETMLMDIYDNPIAVKNALDQLMSGTMTNLIQNGVPQALTGPLVRGDVSTLQSHLQALRNDPLLYETYVNLAKLSYPMLRARGTDINKIDNLLKQEEEHASDNT